MELDYNALNILILFGGLQGFILCLFLYPRRKVNIIGVDFFLLFLFSLSFFNVIYAVLDMDLFKYHRPLHMFPFPYKWLIGAGFYFYIKNQFTPKDRIPYHRKEWYILAPAFIYMAMRVYWFAIAINENSYRITKELVVSGFFAIHEYFIMFFTFFLIIASLQFLKKQQVTSQKAQLTMHWLQLFCRVFLVITTLDILLFTIDLVIHDGQETFGVYYATLIINSLFIYWIGYKGFTKPNQFFTANATEEPISEKTKKEIAQKLKKVMDEDELYRNPNLSVSKLAASIDLSVKDFSRYVNEVLGMNFSEFLNSYRIEKVKQLLSSPDAQKYTLVTLAQTAGFSSKSSFNATFKKLTGKTPSEYKKEIHNS